MPLLRRDPIVERVDLGDDGAVTAKTLTAAARAGTAVIALDNRVGLTVNGILRIGAAPDDEYLTIAALPNPSPGNAAPNAGNVVLAHALNRDHPLGTPARLQTDPVVNPARPATTLLIDADIGSASLPVTDGTGYAQDEFVRLTPAGGGQPLYHRLAANAVSLDARLVDLTVPLSRAHAAGAAVAERAPLLNLQALDTGDWGNRLRVSVQDEPAGVVPRTTVSSVIDANHIRLGLRRRRRSGNDSRSLQSGGRRDGRRSVESDGRQPRRQLYDHARRRRHLAPRSRRPGWRSGHREFRLSVYLFRQPDPAMPSRNETILDTEVFRYLSMDPRHSRYVQDVIGDINGALRLSDRRPEGESWYIRVSDLNPSTGHPSRSRNSGRCLAGWPPASGAPCSGRSRCAAPIRSARSRKTITSVRTIRSGGPHRLHSLRNIEEISIVACPGRTDRGDAERADQPLRADALPLRRARRPAAAAGHARRRADSAPAVRHQIRGALSPVAADSRSVLR